MFRSLLSAVLIFALFITMLLSPQRALACEDRMPLTLLQLHRTSNFIYVGKYDKTVEGEPTEDTPEYQAIPIKKHFSISSALKGKTRKFITIDETEYRYKNQEPGEEAEEEHGDVSEEDRLQPGDTVLLFLNPAEEGDGVEPTEWNDGIKKMTPEKLSAYEARIRELNTIFSVAKPKYSDIVDWLVRCAENPLTRWEGAFELLQSFQQIDWQEERAKHAKENPGADAAQTGEYEPEVPAEFETGDPNIAKALTDAHKTTLTKLVLDRKLPEKTDDATEKRSMAEGDRELIDLVKRWGDPRLAPNLVAQLRYDSSDADFTSELMATISSLLDDEGLRTIADSYSGIRWESDEDETPADAPEDTDVANSAKNSTEAPTPTDTTETSETSDTELQSDDPGAVNTHAKQPKRKTYGELRVELLQEFLAKADRVIAQQENKRTAKLNR